MARALLVRIEEIDANDLAEEIAITLEVARRQAEQWVRAADWYWLVFDPMMVGFFALFAPTAYAGGFLLGALSPVFATFQFRREGDLHRYRGLIADYARLVDQMEDRTRGQAERGIRMPVVQLDQSVAMLKGFRAAAEQLFSVSDDRLPGYDSAAFQTAVSRDVLDLVHPAFDSLLSLLESGEYRSAAPSQVGMAQFPGGREIYDELVRLHTTLELTPVQVHQAGLDRMARVRDAIVNLFEEIGFQGTAHEYLHAMEQSPDWRADGAEAIAAVFRRYIDRIAPHVPEYFSFLPEAGHDVAPLSEAQSGSMTFGYYDAPKPGQPSGIYRFNARNLSRNPLGNIAALNYHELVPGHHLHLASQRENPALPPLRQHSFFNAFNEGWAEYAAIFAGEIGMYQAPEERFGRLMMDAFLTSRLVVDTGMNALGWSLEQARDYLRANSFMPETEIRSETIRYSSDIPGQSLAYKLGDEFLISLREKMRVRLGRAFDLRAFHDKVLSAGALPLPLVAANIEAETERLLPPGAPGQN